MMGERTVSQEALFYSFSLEGHVPQDHLLRSPALGSEPINRIPESAEA